MIKKLKEFTEDRFCKQIPQESDRVPECDVLNFERKSSTAIDILPKMKPVNSVWG